jgi:hypothetical protein
MEKRPAKVVATIHSESAIQGPCIVGNGQPRPGDDEGSPCPPRGRPVHLLMCPLPQQRLELLAVQLLLLDQRISELCELIAMLAQYFTGHLISLAQYSLDLAID